MAVLLDNQKSKTESVSSKTSTWKKPLKLAVVHLALLFVSILYAVCGTMIFMTVEMPNEQSVRKASVDRIMKNRWETVDFMVKLAQEPGITEQEWRRKSWRKLNDYTNLLYAAHKKEFVKFKHLQSRVRKEKEEEKQRRDENFKNETNIGLQQKFANENETGVWNLQSAFMFCITTMSTIGRKCGYGNIVPVTLKGRVICIFFALIGTPLAIITIGDFGKFLSEFIVHCYKSSKGWWQRLMDCLRCISRKQRLEMILKDTTKNEDDDEVFTYEDILARHVQVPVVLVFGILILYVALGGFLFKYLENWTYIDAFYFCFIRYMWIMLLYIGFGLAVTTMCIDLVGRQYVWKIHYFGRKFKEADLLQLLKRKRMIERRLAIAQHHADLRQIYFENLKKYEEACWDHSNEPEAEAMIAEALDRKLSFLVAANFNKPTQYAGLQYQCDENDNDKLHLIESCIDNENLRTTANTDQVSDHGFVQYSAVDSSRAPEVLDSKKMLILLREISNLDSTIVFPSPLSLESNGSEGSRLILYTKWRSMTHERSPSGPDLPADECKISTPGSVEERAIYRKMAEKDQSPLSFESNEIYKIFQDDLDFSKIGDIMCYDILQDKVTREQVKRDKRIQSAPNILQITNDKDSSQSVSKSVAYVEMQFEDETDDENVSLPTLLSPMDAPYPCASISRSVSPCESTLDFNGVEHENPEDLYHSVHETEGIILDEEFRRDPFPPVVAAFSAETFRKVAKKMRPLLFHKNVPVFGVSADTIEMEQTVENIVNCPSQFVGQTIPDNVTENYCFVVRGDGIDTENLHNYHQKKWRPTSKPVRYYFSQDLQTFQRVNVVRTSGKIIRAELAAVQQQQNRGGDEFSRTSSLSLRRNARKEDATIQSSPLWKKWPAAAQPEVEPKIRKCWTPQTQRKVTSSVVSRFYSSQEDLSRKAGTIHAYPILFEKRNVRRHAPEKASTLPSSVNDQSQSYQKGSKNDHETTRLDVQRYHSTSVRLKKVKEVDLTDVYKVTRFYSYWKSCTSFHRIFTIIEPLNEIKPPSVQSSGGRKAALIGQSFKRKIFVQYLWRNAKENDKLRVANEIKDKREHQNAQQQQGASLPALHKPRDRHFRMAKFKTADTK
uniref:Potassium channel domain-containing protein n=1 Tax=Romanomermis culicivorax TaxID=13658 RepID=A0A915KF04_ROMCU